MAVTQNLLQAPIAKTPFTTSLVFTAFSTLLLTFLALTVEQCFHVVLSN